MSREAMEFCSFVGFERSHIDERHEDNFLCSHNSVDRRQAGRNIILEVLHSAAVRSQWVQERLPEYGLGNRCLQSSSVNMARVLATKSA